MSGFLAKAHAGAMREARTLLEQERPSLVGATPAEVLWAAEVYAATGAFRRSTALLIQAASAAVDDAQLATAAARSAIVLGHERRAWRLLARHEGTMGAWRLIQTLARTASPPTTPQPTMSSATEPLAVLGEHLDALLLAAEPPTSSALEALLNGAPRFTRARLALAESLARSGEKAQARTVLRAGLKIAEDARLDVALATLAASVGAHDETALHLARGRARYPDLAARADLRLMLSLATWHGGRREDAISLLAGAKNLTAGEAELLLLLQPRVIPASTAGAPPAAAPSTDSADNTISSTSAPPAAQGPKGADIAPVAMVIHQFGTNDDVAASRTRLALLGIVVVLLAAFTWKFALPRVMLMLNPPAPPPPPAEVVEVEKAPPPGMTGPAFAQEASACGFTISNNLEVGTSWASTRDQLRRTGWQGKKTPLGGLRMKIPEEISTGGGELDVLDVDKAVSPLLVWAPGREGGFVLGGAGFATTTTQRATVGKLVRLSDLAPASLVASACHSAGDTGQCALVITKCRALTAVIKAICVDGQATVETLPNCLLEFAFVAPPMPHGVAKAPVFEEAPAPDAKTGSVGGDEGVPSTLGSDVGPDVGPDVGSDAPAPQMPPESVPVPSPAANDTVDAVDAVDAASAGANDGAPEKPAAPAPAQPSANEAPPL